MKHASQAAVASAGSTIIHGVDFSGADGGGAAKIRIAERELAPRSAVAVRANAPSSIGASGLKRAMNRSITFSASGMAASAAAWMRLKL